MAQQLNTTMLWNHFPETWWQEISVSKEKYFSTWGRRAADRWKNHRL
jgi:hypothetical protein